jgi:hypothetical protein
LTQEQRRLAAILAADVAGYSRLMAADESGTLARLKRLRIQVIEPKIAKYYGRIVGSAGDSLLVEFASAVSAVQCAVEVQEGLAGESTDLPEVGQWAFFRKPSCHSLAARKTYEARVAAIGVFTADERGIRPRIFQKMGIRSRVEE